MKKITILGSTGSIGTQTLHVIAAHPNEYCVYGLAALSNARLLSEQALQFKPQRIACAVEFEPPMGVDAIFGEDAATKLAADPNCDIVVLAISGFAALKPLLAAIKNGKCIAIANKESLVCGGDLVAHALKEHSAQLIPVDSEQAAIFQCLQNGKREEVKRLILTASGGPFFKKSREELKAVTVDEVLKHPTWSMGKKITLDSATLFNKGLEVIEASRLFDMGAEQISVLIHPQSIVHSMVEYCDNTTIANLSQPDMRLPIQYALSYPNRQVSLAAPLDLGKIGQLSFYQADEKRFPSLRLAYDCLKLGGGYPVVYNGANERAAQLYFEGRLGFLNIDDCVQYACDNYVPQRMSSLEAVLEANMQARRLADSYFLKLKG